MLMSITTSIANTDLKNGDNGLELKSVTVVVNFNDGDDYFGGQVVLTASDDGISLKSTTDEMKEKAIAKAKKRISESVVGGYTESVPVESETLNKE